MSIIPVKYLQLKRGFLLPVEVNQNYMVNNIIHYICMLSPDIMDIYCKK